ncbi:MAG: hypothetical protein HYW05_02065 [Candidatus Diapherotrites archaeon]|nr:hypothetical protein [Candidatus Diapherotrites archaeon]
MAFELSDGNIAKIALIASVLGLLLVVFALEQQKPTETSISGILQGRAMQKAGINAKILSAYTAKNALMLQLYDGNKISAVKFNPGDEERRIAKKGNFVRVVGSVRQYQGNPEIIIEKIALIEQKLEAAEND